MGKKQDISNESAESAEHATQLIAYALHICDDDAIAAMHAAGLAMFVFARLGGADADALVKYVRDTFDSLPIGVARSALADAHDVQRFYKQSAREHFDIIERAKRTGGKR